MQSLIQIIVCNHKMVPTSHRLNAHLKSKTILIFYIINTTGMNEQVKCRKKDAKIKTPDKNTEMETTFKWNQCMNKVRREVSQHCWVVFRSNICWLCQRENWSNNCVCAHYLPKRKEDRRTYPSQVEYVRMRVWTEFKQVFYHQCLHRETIGHKFNIHII